LTMWITDKYLLQKVEEILSRLKWKYYNCKWGKNIKNGQDLTFTINASVTYKLGLGIMIGIAITGLIIQLIIAKR
jgi:hypothetical protein